MIPDPVWIEPDDALAIHDAQLREHGGPPGLRDCGLLESALARPRNIAVYLGSDIASLAAAYAYGLANNHPFVDGNKRTSFGVCLVFLDLNGFDLPADDEANIATWLKLAAGQISESELAVWLRQRIVPLEGG